MVSFKFFYTITVRSNQHGPPWDISFVVLGKSGCDVEKAIFNFILQIAFFRSFFFFVMPCDDCPGTLLMISQQCFRIWFVAIRQQTFTWANTDPNLCHHMTYVTKPRVKQIILKIWLPNAFLHSECFYIAHKCHRRFHWFRLTHCGLVTPLGDIDLGQHWLR